jgi:hypothetical protein
MLVLNEQIIREIYMKISKNGEKKFNNMNKNI